MLRARYRSFLASGPRIMRRATGLERHLGSHARTAILLATVAGLAIAAWAIGSTGIASIIAIARRLGVGGFLSYCLYSLSVLGLLGAAWLAASGESFKRFGLFVWARLIREAASDLLPFSQVGGIVVSVRMLTAKGIAGPRVHASLIVDLTTEMASQLIFTLFGLALVASILLGNGPVGSLRVPMLGGVVILVAIMAIFLSAQRWILPLAGNIARRLLPGAVDATEAIGAELRVIYGQRGRIVLSFALNLAAWVASAVGAWVALRLMDVELSIWTVLSIESVIFMLRSAAFTIPGGIGVQEAGYALAAPLVGLPPESALALALAKRARDLAIGLPTLVAWQIAEARAVVLGPRKY